MLFLGVPPHVSVFRSFLVGRGRVFWLPWRKSLQLAGRAWPACWEGGGTGNGCSLVGVQTDPSLPQTLTFQVGSAPSFRWACCSPAQSLSRGSPLWRWRGTLTYLCWWWDLRVCTGQGPSAARTNGPHTSVLNTIKMYFLIVLQGEVFAPCSHSGT